MIDPKQFDQLAKQLFSSLPEGIQNLEQDIQNNFKAILHTAFAKLDLVTREEFDVQCKVLARTREKLDSLQKQVESIQPKNPKTKK